MNWNLLLIIKTFYAIFRNAHVFISHILVIKLILLERERKCLRNSYFTILYTILLVPSTLNMKVDNMFTVILYRFILKKHCILKITSVEEDMEGLEQSVIHC